MSKLIALADLTHLWKPHEAENSPRLHGTGRLAVGRYDTQTTENLAFGGEVPFKLCGAEIVFNLTWTLLFISRVLGTVIAFIQLA